MLGDSIGCWYYSEEYSQPAEGQPTFTCSICLDDCAKNMQAVMPCCHRNSSTIAYCAPCINLLCHRAPGGIGKCPTCTASVKLSRNGRVSLEPVCNCTRCGQRVHRRLNLVQLNLGLCPSCRSEVIAVTYAACVHAGNALLLLNGSVPHVLSEYYGGHFWERRILVAVIVCAELVCTAIPTWCLWRMCSSNFREPSDATIALVVASGRVTSALFVGYFPWPSDNRPCLPGWILRILVG
jgi:hypothetical protein